MKIDQLLNTPTSQQKPSGRKLRYEVVAQALPKGLKSGEEILDAAFKYLVKSEGRKAAEYHLNVDDDFPGEVVTEYLRINSVNESASDSRLSKLLDIEAVKDDQEEFVKLLKDWKALAQKEHASYMRRNGRDNWYETRTSLKATAKSISDKFQKMFGTDESGSELAIDCFNFTQYTPFQFWKKVVSIDVPLTEAWKVTVRNKDGEGKKFPSNMVDSSEADAWRKSSSKVAVAKQEKLDEKDAKEKLDIELHRRVINAIGQFFPDEEPIDRVLSFMRKNDLEMDDVNRVMKRFQNGETYNQYLASMWDDYSADAIADAKNAVKLGKEPTDSIFFEVGNDSKIIKNSNPWK